MVLLNFFKYPESPIKHQERNVVVLVNRKEWGTGTLFISERTLAWQKSDNEGFSIEYPHINVHAISNDESLYHKKCVYIMLGHELVIPGDEPQNGNNPDSEEEGDGDFEESGIYELILDATEDNPTSINSIYEAISIGQELNPDPNDDMIEDEDEDEDDNMYADAEDELGDEGHYILENGVNGSREVGQAIRQLQQLMVHNQINENGIEDDEVDEQFEDAD